eukprot:TRINITY_DN35743_c0_g1_i1.p1 TRINITY_DN35743_c0_g1~~TRINITY_DN35743_c0_g1_i1.p1  ORF type:complete len:362 (+),score=42.56 TRINITY_DN35743_c0_g1_i1:127-1212(+)
MSLSDYSYALKRVSADWHPISPVMQLHGEHLGVGQSSHSTSCLMGPQTVGPIRVPSEGVRPCNLRLRNLHVTRLGCRRQHLRDVGRGTPGRQGSRRRVAMAKLNEGAIGGPDDDFIEARVVDAVRMVPSRNRLFMTMANGSEVEIEHVNPTAGRLLYEASSPTIFLQMADNTDLMLPIVVGELAILLLMKAFRREAGARPHYYELMKDLVESIKYEVKMVRVTTRVVDTYYARIYLGRPGDDEKDYISIDARPSDAINLAVRCEVPIFVSKSIILNDAVRRAYEPALAPGNVRTLRGGRTGVKDAVLDSPTQEEHDFVSEEMQLVQNLYAAVQEERYTDAARLRDELHALRQQSGRQLNKH